MWYWIILPNSFLFSWCGGCTLHIHFVQNKYKWLTTENGWMKRNGSMCVPLWKFAYNWQLFHFKSHMKMSTWCRGRKNKSSYHLRLWDYIWYNVINSCLSVQFSNNLVTHWRFETEAFWDARWNKEYTLHGKIILIRRLVHKCNQTDGNEDIMDTMI